MSHREQAGPPDEAAAGEAPGQVPGPQPAPGLTITQVAAANVIRGLRAELAEAARYDGELRQRNDWQAGEIRRLSGEAEKLRAGLALLRGRVGDYATGLELSAKATAPSKKSGIESGCAAALRGLLEDT